MDTQLSKIIRPLLPIPRTTSGFGANGLYPVAAADLVLGDLSSLQVSTPTPCHINP
jgi:hypothetical protein